MLFFLLLAASLSILAGCNSATTLSVRPAKIDAVMARQLLTEGNNRFITDKPVDKDFKSFRSDLIKRNQKPFAVIVTCSESDVSPELLFDQGIGDLFVVRTVANVIDPVIMGCIEYGMEHNHAPLIVVLGHTNCNSIKEVVEGHSCPGNIPSVSNKLKPVVDKARQTGEKSSALVERAELYNILETKAQIDESPLVKAFKRKSGIKVLAAKYDAATGIVEWYEDGGCDLGEKSE